MVLLMLVCTIISIIIGIVGIIFAASVIGKMAESDADGEAARIIVRALRTWDTPMSTAIEVVDSAQGC